MNRNLQKTAEQLRVWLMAKGCKVSTSRVRHTPLLAMTKRAVWGRECLAGVVRDVAIVRFGGCLLHWRQ